MVDHTNDGVKRELLLQRAINKLRASAATFSVKENEAVTLVEPNFHPLGIY